MDRSAIARDLENALFEIAAEQPLSEHEKYVIQEPLSRAKGAFKYRVLSSSGAEVEIASPRQLPTDPFLVMRGPQSGPESAHRYEAITLPELERLTEDIYRNVRHI